MNLDEVSRLYAEGLRLMNTGETDLADFRKALGCFIKGAELGDRFCALRLKEMLETPQYRRRLSSETGRLWGFAASASSEWRLSRV